jgi:hypothetical protein
MIIRLINAGADVSARDNKNKTPQDYLSGNDKNELKKLFSK